MYKKKLALIIGITSQDGYYLSKFLYKKKYSIIGTYRTEDKTKKNLVKKYKIFKVNILNFNKIKKIIEKYKPDEIYNFAGLSDLKNSEKNILYTDKINNFFVLKLINLLSRNKQIKFFQSLSSELFARKGVAIKTISEVKNLSPSNAYGISKLSSYYYIDYLRKKYDLKIYCGFFFNHESIFRDQRFIVKQLINHLINCSLNNAKIFEIRNILSAKDFGAAKDYAEATWHIIQQNKKFDFIIGSGKIYNLLEIIKEISKVLKLKILIKKEKNNYNIFYDKNKIITSNNTKKELVLKADNKDLKKFTNWKPRINFKELLKEITLEEKKKLN